MATETPAHLGGYTEGGDPATFFPDLWRWVVGEFEIGSVLDVGCGEGSALRYFRELGCAVTGVDGVAQDDPDIVEHDYTTGPLESRRPYDLGWSAEFVEHVEERYLPNFLADFARCRLLLMTHGTPGQLGHHHVNCQITDYWIGALAAIGFEFKRELTETCRVYSRANLEPLNHFARSGLAFARPT